ncbi:MAG TPA: hypothetical protein VFK57_07500 [Vicinamibacterales bacterium]|nr:hypothetical protein [Vicinamibacterales bacterium]
MKHRILIQTASAAAAAVLAVACGGSKNSTPTTPTPVAATLTAPKLEAPLANEQLDTLRPTLTVQNVTSDQPTGTRTYEFQISDTAQFTAATTQSVNGFDATVGKTGVPEGGGGKTSFAVDADLQPTTIFYWRARAVQGTATGPWSDTFQFKSKLVGFNRAGELYDPLIHGETIGTIVGSASFIPGKGLRLNDGVSHVRYLLASTVSSGEFSMDVEGLRANGPGDKAKVFGMQEGQTDFITNRYRVDIQYRGVLGFPPNAITFRALYGDGDDLDKRYEPDTATRMRSVYNLNPANVYYWRANWGAEFRLIVKDGGVGTTGINGNTIYNIGMPSLKGTYTPSTHYAYLGAPVGRSGTESASIGGAVYRNVYIGSKPRPETLGSAIR